MRLWPNRALHPMQEMSVPEFAPLRLSATLLCLTLTACASLSTAPLGDHDRLMALAEQVRRGGDPASAAALYERAVRQGDDSPDLLRALGETRLAAGDAAGAAEAFRDLLRQDDEDPQALLGLGTAELQLGRFDRAVRTLEQAASALGTAQAYNRLGTAQVLAGRFGDAQAAYGTAIDQAPGDLDIRSNLALALALNDQADAAQRAIAAVARSPLAEPHHLRQQMLVLTLIGDEAGAAQALAGLPEQDRLALLAEARSIRQLDDPAARARAIGLLTGAR